MDDRNNLDAAVEMIVEAARDPSRGSVLLNLAILRLEAELDARAHGIATVAMSAPAAPAPSQRRHAVPGAIVVIGAAIGFSAAAILARYL